MNLFLEEFDVFVPTETRRTREHGPPEMTRRFLNCYYRDIHRIRLVEREPQNAAVWLSCGFDRLSSRDAADRFSTDPEHIVEDAFDRLVEQAVRRGLLDLAYCIGSSALARGRVRTSAGVRCLCVASPPRRCR